MVELVCCHPDIILVEGMSQTEPGVTQPLPGFSLVVKAQLGDL